MKAWLRILFIFCSLGILAVSCKEDPPEDDFSYQQEYLGNWNCNETEGWNAPQFYEVNITAGSSTDEIIINGLYNNPDVSIRANINEYDITIMSQFSDSIQFAGSGQANVAFDQISLNFTADDGSGGDDVKAVLTK